VAGVFLWVALRLWVSDQCREEAAESTELVAGGAGVSAMKVPAAIRTVEAADRTGSVRWERDIADEC
jgi:hypothetical protein